MKVIKLVVLFLAFSSIANAQLTNTKWAGIMNVPGSTEVLLSFKADTLSLVSKVDGKSFEDMTYSIIGDVINLIKVSGESPCDVGFKAALKFVVTNKQLTLSVTSAECEGWATAWPDKPFIKQY
jgi:hypothetical protein